MGYFVLIGVVVGLVFTPFMVPAAMIGRFFPTFFTLHYFLLVKGIKLYMALTPLKLKVDFSRVPKAINRPFLFISNHRSHLDMFIYLSHVYRLRAVARKSLFNIPILGRYMALSGHYSLDKGDLKQYLDEEKKIREGIHSQDSVLFFPEMTRCEHGHRGVQKFKLLPFKIAREENALIIPLVIKGSDLVWPKGQVGMDYQHKVEVVALDPIDTSLFDKTTLLAEEIHKKMAFELGLET